MKTLERAIEHLIEVQGVAIFEKNGEYNLAYNWNDHDYAMKLCWNLVGSASQLINK